MDRRGVRLRTERLRWRRRPIDRNRLHKRGHDVGQLHDNQLERRDTGGSPAGSTGLRAGLRARRVRPTRRLRGRGAAAQPVDLIEPDGGANAANCNAIGNFIDTLNFFQPGDSAEFGTAAIIDGTNGGKEVALVATLDQANNFKLLGAYFLKPQIDTDPPPDVDFEAPAAAFVKALREDDCTAAHAALSPVSRLAHGNVKQFCSTFEDSYLTDPMRFGARLQADPAADLVDLGGTRNVDVFGLATEPAGYRTIIVGTVEGGEPAVTDVVPVEP